MKKRSAKNGNSFKRIFNKLGMTYIELICALALLSLIVVMFTPMLLSSYDQLYVAGETVEKVYDSMEEIEEGLASRGSDNIANVGMTFKMNGEELFKNLNIGGRKVVSHLQGGLETVFYGVRARVDLLTPDIIYDDKPEHEVILQTTGLDWKNADVTLFNITKGNIEDLKANLKPNQIIIDVIKPDKKPLTAGDTTSVETEVYNKGDRVTIDDGTFKPDSTNKRISFTFRGADFTNSPLKICVYYKNERGVLKTLSDFLYIKPAHIIFAGKGTSDYFTSAGIEQVTTYSGTGENRVQTKQYQFNIAGRAMSLDNSNLLNEGPHSSGATIKTVLWVDNDDQKGFDSYYVMAGTNGAVYRMYNLQSSSSLQSLLGAQNTINNPTSDVRYNISTGETIHPSFWSGEISDQYYFRTQENAMGYGVTESNKIDCSSGTRYRYFDTSLRYMMMFSGYTTGYKYQHQANRRISYILTEKMWFLGGDTGASFRLAGKLDDINDYEGYTAVWEPDSNSGWNYYVKTNALENGSLDDVAANRGWAPVYLYTGNGTAEDHFDRHLAYLRLKSYTSVNPFTLTGSDEKDSFNKGDFWFPTDIDKEDDLSGNKPNSDLGWLNKDYAKKVNVTSAAYLPGAGSDGKGQVVYFGSVPAYAYIRQSSDIGKTSAEGGHIVYNTDDVKASRPTIYVVCGTDGIGSTVYRCYSDNNNPKSISNLLRDAGFRDADNDPNNDVSAFSSAAIYGHVNNEIVVKAIESNLAFTFGYCSRWRMAIGDVTSDGTKEETRSYEKYFVKSNPGRDQYIPFVLNETNTVSILNACGPNNLFYHVWFPGEFYNLTETATLDEVTVAVGYTVSGSTYMRESNAVHSGMYGTALGSIYNDGVLAAYTSSGYSYNLGNKGGKTTIFQNLLYFKSPNILDIPGWGMQQHARANIRLVKVGLGAETTRTVNGNTETNQGIKKYYAYYADNNANVYKSLVATATVSFQEGSNESDDSTNETVTLVNAIRAEVEGDGVTTPPTYGMQPIKVWGHYMSEFFTEITAIEVKDDIVVIAGKPNNNAMCGNRLIVGVKNSDNTWIWKLHTFRYNPLYADDWMSSSVIDCAKIIGDYIYICGYGDVDCDGKNDCWVGGISVDFLKNAPDDTPVQMAPYNTSAKDNVFIWQNLGESNRLYAVDGYVTG